MTDVLLALWGILVLAIIGYGFLFIWKDIKKATDKHDKL